ncbi:MAG: TrkA family potassium uptake protein [bacterium]
MSDKIKSVAVIGLGQFGSQVAVSLSQKNFDVLAIDNTMDPVSEIKDLVSQAVMLDATDKKAMNAININTIDIAVVAFGSNVQSSLLSTALLQSFQIENIFVRSINSLQESILTSLGIQNIISIEKEMGIQISNSISSKGVGRYIPLSNSHAIIEVSVPKPFINKTLRSLHLRHKYHVNIVGIKSKLSIVKDDGEIDFEVKMTDIPDPSYPLQKEDILIISGTDDKLNQFINLGKYND